MSAAEAASTSLALACGCGWDADGGLAGGAALGVVIGSACLLMRAGCGCVIAGV